MGSSRLSRFSVNGPTPTPTRPFDKAGMKGGEGRCYETVRKRGRRASGQAANPPSMVGKEPVIMAPWGRR